MACQVFDAGNHTHASNMGLVSTVVFLTHAVVENHRVLAFRLAGAAFVSAAQQRKKCEWNRKGCIVVDAFQLL